MKSLFRGSTVVLTLVLLMLLSPGTKCESEYITIPDLNIFLMTAVFDAGEYETDGQAYTLTLYERDSGWSDDIQLWFQECIKDGYAITGDKLDGKNAYLLTKDDKTVILVPQYTSTNILVMLPEGVKFIVPITDTTPEPTAANVPTEQPCGHYDLEYVEEKNMCPNCFGTGHCPLCHGTGTYRRYGQAIDCPTECSFCNGEGYYIQIVPKYIWISDDGC